MKQRRAWAMILARGTPNFVWIGFLTYNSIIVVQLLDGSAAQAGLLAAAGSVSYALAATQAGRITAAFDSRLWPLVATNVAMAGGLCLVFLVPALPAAVAAVVVMGTGFGVVLSLYRSVITGMAPMSVRGGLVSLGEGTGRLTSTITPIGMGAAIGLASEAVGFDRAVQLVGVGTGVVAAVVGIACLFLVSYSPPVTMEQ